MQSSDRSEDYLDEMILDGLVEVAGLDADTGEMLYSFTSKAAEVIPTLAAEAEKFFQKVIMYFWENGFILMDVTEESPTVTVTEKALDPAEVENLSVEYRQALNLILEALRIR